MRKSFLNQITSKQWRNIRRLGRKITARRGRQPVGQLFEPLEGRVLYSASVLGVTSTATAGPIIVATGAINDVSEAHDHFGKEVVAGDFNGDGRDDLAVGVPDEDVNGHADAGAINVIYGSASGLSYANDQFIHQNSGTLTSSAEAGDHFGRALAVGDFNNDGYDDLAVGVPGEDFNKTNEADGGVVHILFGTSSGLSTTKHQFWHQDKAGIISSAEAGDKFGRALAAGDFDGDGIDDLAIGVHGEDHNSKGLVDAGAVNVLYGVQNKGLSAAGNQMWHQNTAGIYGVAETGDRFGYTLAAGDFDNDGVDDLAVGSPWESVGSAAGAGAVNVIYGTFNTGLTATDNQIWYQGRYGEIAETAEANDNFGLALAAGDFDGDNRDDLAIGVPGETLSDGVYGQDTQAGGVHVLYGSAEKGLWFWGNQFRTQRTSGIDEDSDSYDRFGSALATGDMNGDGYDELAIGVAGEDFSGLSNAGVVHVIRGSNHIDSYSSWADSEMWHQNTTGVYDIAESGDSFAAALAMGDFNGDGEDDLAVGVPNENVGSATNAGAVNVLKGVDSYELEFTSGGFWNQNSASNVLVPL